jgi:hypothetical protein
MTSTTARCDHIVALIDACLAEVEATHEQGRSRATLAAASIGPSSPAIHS